MTTKLPENIWGDENLVGVLKGNGVVVMPTDTLYGIVCKAQSISAVNRIYAIRKRNPKKPCIILIGEIGELEKFSIILSLDQKNALKKYWPGPVSIILECKDDSLEYLHRGTKTLAFRIPAPQALRDLLLKVGPLIAPSANTETFPPNETIAGAKKYFGDSVDLYVDGGFLAGKASKVIQLHSDDSVTVIRP
jgi:L-threonylcarbamoyladenylate synthase